MVYNKRANLTATPSLWQVEVIMKEYTLWNENGATKIEWYEPKNKKSDAAILVFPGGGYVNLCDYEGKEYAEYLNDLGLTAFVVYYRRDPNYFPIPLLDARRAVRFVRANAETFGIAKDKIAVMGSSAGGHLCALVSTYTERIEGETTDEIDSVDYLPNAQILCYPVISSDESISHKWSYRSLLGENYPDKEKYSPELLVTENTPRAFIWHTGEDQSVAVENSYRYAVALSRKGVSCETHVFPFGRHGMALSHDDTHVAQWKELLINWFKLYKWL